MENVVNTSTGAQKPRSVAAQKKHRPNLRVTKLDEDRCQVCNITRAEAGLIGRIFVEHHLIDRAALIEGGFPPDVQRFLGWACSDPCHATLTTMRRSTARALTQVYAIGNKGETHNPPEPVVETREP